jgi:hypothetical protein
MAKELYDWVKLALDNKWLVIMCFGSLTGVVTGVTQSVTNSDLEASKVKAIHEVARGFQQAMVEMEPKPEKRIYQKVYKTDCGLCKTLMNNHLGEFHQ